MKLRLWLVLCWLLLAATPAYANNPPTPDGIFSLLLIFVVAILAPRLAGATFPPEKRRWKILKGIGLALAFFLTLGGTGIAFVPLLILLFYGLHRGGYVIQHGQGGKRFLVGGFVILFTLFAVANYFVSLNTTYGTSASESAALGRLRAIVTAEVTFREAARLDVNKNRVPEYGTLDQLRQAGLVDDHIVSPGANSPYRFTLVLAGDPARDEKEFFVYATPTHYGRESAAWMFVPGGSLVNSLRPTTPWATRTFASDESGVIRQADLGGSRPVTREEARKWTALD